MGVDNGLGPTKQSAPSMSSLLELYKSCAPLQPGKARLSVSGPELRLLGTCIY